jgi:type IV pilus modification protein PilV
MLTALRRRRLGQRGIGLLDALVAMAVLAFGLLAITRFQTRSVSQATEAQTRQIASEIATEHLSTVLVDVGNAACYTVPPQGNCSNAAARTRAAAWAASAPARLRVPSTASSAAATLNAAQTLMTVVIEWPSRVDNDPPHTLTSITDVRP